MGHQGSSSGPTGRPCQRVRSPVAQIAKEFCGGPGFPIRKGVGRDEAAASEERITKSRLFRNGFGPCVGALEADLGIFGPGGNQAPAEFGDFKVGGASPDDGGAVGGPNDGLGLSRVGNLFFTDFGFRVLRE